jgi:hypothetical protein
MNARRFTVLADRRGSLTAVPAGDARRRLDAEQRGFRLELARVNTPRNRTASVHGAYGALLRIYAL